MVLSKAEFTVFGNQGIPLTRADSFAYWLISFVLNCSLILDTVNLGIKELLNKEQIGNSEPFTVTNLPIYLRNSEQIDISEQFCDDQKVP